MSLSLTGRFELFLRRICLNPSMDGTEKQLRKRILTIEFRPVRSIDGYCGPGVRKLVERRPSMRVHDGCLVSRRCESGSRETSVWEVTAS